MALAVSGTCGLWRSELELVQVQVQVQEGCRWLQAQVAAVGVDGGRAGWLADRLADWQSGGMRFKMGTLQLKK